MVYVARPHIATGYRASRPSVVATLLLILASSSPFVGAAEGHGSAELTEALLTGAEGLSGVAILVGILPGPVGCTPS